jgi:hypothetical protein
MDKKIAGLLGAAAALTAANSAAATPATVEGFNPPQPTVTYWSRFRMRLPSSRPRRYRKRCRRTAKHG